ncbi:unnamed protein product [Didymodactylos carnosus]|uniref:Uncharacterized protein n=1 Tax=Didymodactylos carnosus TaxID=1234261 RepID=A0A813TIF7_9BILA|nr:unnamed protein product [Didymodactylos carnosus]CAF0833290.1 unnamed protein product [Didymodactylos carnosus]CAF3598944.1 unnamed protein product [Didymodactylos carnosus]CAF3617960.1 unnamed protein product [Didymodactylos carnosus]
MGSKQSTCSKKTLKYIRSKNLSNAAIIYTLYEYMHSVDVFDASGRSPLHYAAIVGNDETLQTLLMCNPDVNRFSKDGTTPIHEAIIHNHPGALTLLLQRGSNIKLPYQNRIPSLSLAVCLNHTTIVELLIRVGTDPNATDTEGRSSLHYAAYKDNIKMFHILLSSIHPLNINMCDNHGYSVLDYARANSQDSSQCVDLLLQLRVYDPDRGISTIDNIQLDMPSVKIFTSSIELCSLDNKQLKKKKNKLKVV